MFQTPPMTSPLSQLCSVWNMIMESNSHDVVICCIPTSQIQVYQVDILFPTPCASQVWPALHEKIIN